MARSETQRTRTRETAIHKAVFAFVIPILFLAATQLTAQTFSVIHNFTGPDGTDPASGLTLDRAGNVYGTAGYGGTYGNGLVFKMTLHGSAWLFTPIYNFRGGDDGGSPFARAVFGPDGSLYGTTGNYNSVYNLRPPPTRPRSVLQEWNHTVLYYAENSQDLVPANSDVVFDGMGNLYGASIAGGNMDCYEGCGFIYELTPSAGSWTYHTIYSFDGAGNGPEPQAVDFDNSGNPYGVTYSGGPDNQGSVFQLTHSGSGWTMNPVYLFNYNQTGSSPQGGLISDAAGNFYGTTSAAPNASGTVFELSPSAGGWTATVLYTLPETYRGGAVSSLTMDSQGNLYGTIDGYCEECDGAVYKLTRGSGGWTYTELHHFTWNGSDGGHPHGTVAIDTNGNLYGTASTGGIGCETEGCGVVWKISNQ